MSYPARTTTPEYNTDPNAIGVSHGGKNHALVINSSTGSVFPNCCGYVHFRALELCGEDVEAKLSRSNACNYYAYTADGLQRGQTPKLGAICVWSGGRKGYGHVAIVEAVYTDGSILTSNSNYSGTVFYTKRISPPYHPWSGYNLLGFIYLPWSDEPAYVGTPVTRDASKDQIEIKIDNLCARLYPTTGGNKWGLANKGIYDILGTVIADGYTWYKLCNDLNGKGDALWVAYSPDWATLYLKASEADVDKLKAQVDELTAKVSELEKEIVRQKGAIAAAKTALEEA